MMLFGPFLILIARIRAFDGPPGPQVSIVVVGMMLWLVVHARKWVDSDNKYQQVGGKLVLLGMVLLVCFLIYKFLEALTG
jgi:hypothetical protein